MLSGSHWRRNAPRVSLILVGLCLAAVAGCGDDNPFDMAPVQGKITYEDGSLISVSEIWVDFEPQGQAVGGMAPQSGRAGVDVNDGTFTRVTTPKVDDGLIVGVHRVSAVSYDGQNETELEIVEPEITIVAGLNELHIRVKKP